jgi:hypothetical protein
MSAMLALPVWAQQSTDETRDGANAPDDSTSVTAASTAETTNAVPPRTSFAVPDVPRATPFPGPAPASGDQDSAPGRLTPKFEVAGMYSYINFNPGTGFASWNNNGEMLSFA